MHRHIFGLESKLLDSNKHYKPSVVAYLITVANQLYTTSESSKKNYVIQTWNGKQLQLLTVELHRISNDANLFNCPSQPDIRTRRKKVVVTTAENREHLHCRWFFCYTTWLRPRTTEKCTMGGARWPMAKGQVGRPGWKLDVFERHLLTDVSWHFAFFTKDGKSAVNQSPTCIDMNPAHNVFITDCHESEWLVVYCALRLRLSCIVVYSAVNVHHGKSAATY